MGRFRNQMISVRDLLRKMRSHAVISVLSAVGLATIGCGFVVFSAIGGLDTATYATKVIEEGDQVSIVYADPEGREETAGLLVKMQNVLEEVRQQAGDNFLAVERAEDAVVNADERAQRGFESTAEQIDGITAHMKGSLEAVQEVGRKVEEGNRAGEGFFQSVRSSFDALDESLAAHRQGIAEVNEGISGVSDGIAGVNSSIAGVNDGIAGVNNGIADVNRDVTTLQENLNAFGTSVSGRFTDTDDKLTLLLQQLEQSNQNVLALQTQLEEARQEIETLKGMVTGVGEAQYALSVTIAQTEEKRVLDYNALKSMIDTNAQNITNVSNRVPFALGVDGDGEYGYFKAGADAVIPFRRPGPVTGDVKTDAHSHVSGTACYQTVETEVQQKCGGGMTAYQYANCTKCGNGPDYCAQYPECPSGGSHSLGATHYMCSNCGHIAMSGGYCTDTVTVKEKTEALVCSHQTCGRMHIVNGYHKTGRRECPLSVTVTQEGAGMTVTGYAWRAESGGVISGGANTATVSAAHNGLYICTVSLRDNVTGAVTQQEVSYQVRNLIK